MTDVEVTIYQKLNSLVSLIQFHTKLNGKEKNQLIEKVEEIQGMVELLL